MNVINGSVIAWYNVPPRYQLAFSFKYYTYLLIFPTNVWILNLVMYTNVDFESCNVPLKYLCTCFGQFDIFFMLFSDEQWSIVVCLNKVPLMHDQCVFFKQQKWDHILKCMSLLYFGFTTVSFQSLELHDLLIILLHRFKPLYYIGLGKLGQYYCKLSRDSIYSCVTYLSCCISYYKDCAIFHCGCWGCDRK